MHKQCNELSDRQWKSVCQVQHQTRGKTSTAKQILTLGTCILLQTKVMFDGEYASLEAIYNTHTITVPKPIKVGLPKSVTQKLKNDGHNYRSSLTELAMAGSLPWSTWR